MLRAANNDLLFTKHLFYAGLQETELPTGLTIMLTARAMAMRTPSRRLAGAISLCTVLWDGKRDLALPLALK
jgi:hypothetical protein